MADKCSAVFAADKTHNLIVRLRHNVIRTGLRRINVSYSKIALGDVAKKLRLDTPTPAEDAECIVAKVRFRFRFRFRFGFGFRLRFKFLFRILCVCNVYMGGWGEKTRRTVGKTSDP